MLKRHTANHIFSSQDIHRVEIYSTKNAMHKLNFLKIYNVIQIPQEDERKITEYEMIAYNFLFDFIPKELLYMENNCLKLGLGACWAVHMSGTTQQLETSVSV
jgi:hypothetical protein